MKFIGAARQARGRHMSKAVSMRTPIRYMLRRMLRRRSAAGSRKSAVTYRVGKVRSALGRPPAGNLWLAAKFSTETSVRAGRRITRKFGRTDYVETASNPSKNKRI